MGRAFYASGLYGIYFAAVLGLTIGFSELVALTGSVSVLGAVAFAGWMLGAARERRLGTTSDDGAFLRGALYIIPMGFCGWPVILRVWIRYGSWFALIAVVYMVVCQLGILYYLRPR